MSLETKDSEDKHITDAGAACDTLTCILLKGRRWDLQHRYDSAHVGLSGISYCLNNIGEMKPSAACQLPAFWDP